MRFWIIFVVLVLFCAIVIGVQVFEPKNPVISSEEVPSMMSLKPRLKNVPFVAQLQAYVNDKTNVSETTLRVVQPTTCTTTLQQQQDLRTLGFDPCLVTRMSVR